jgi:hypothetical protein
MVRERLKQVDVSDSPELLRLAEEVLEKQQAITLVRAGEVLATLQPAKPAKKPRARRSDDVNAWLTNLIGIADPDIDPDGPTDVSSNKHKYLAEAYYAKSHPPDEG